LIDKCKTEKKERKMSLKHTTYANMTETQFIQVLINAKQSERLMNYVLQKNPSAFL
jgi:hypothetical protein